MPQKAVESQIVADSYKKNKHKLNAKEQDILEKFYGLGSSVRHTLDEIGRDYLVTRERIRQIKAIALFKIMGKVKPSRLIVKKKK